MNVVAWWSDALVRMLDGDLATREIHFMDGSFLVRVEPAAGRSWRLKRVDNYQIPRIRHAAVVDPVAPVGGAAEAADSSLELCRARGWESRDSARLAALASRLGDRWRAS